MVFVVLAGLVLVHAGWDNKLSEILSVLEILRFCLALEKRATGNLKVAMFFAFLNKCQLLLIYNFELILSKLRTYNSQ